ncbi:MAG: hypothetical protein N3B16_00245 [Candidatus Aminicenantes bacterium]|nr:hypothetical protein [Candidatus Aminicenantes bacterium]
MTIEAAMAADRRTAILNLAIDLEKLATALAEDTFQYFKGRRGLITEKEQAILFKAEAFAASCRLFIRLTEERSGYFSTQYLRTNLFQAFIYLTRFFYELEKEMRESSLVPYALGDCRRLLDRLDREFSSWPVEDNLAYLHQKYVKGANQTVYMIERRGPGLYVRRAFKNLESLYRYNYNQKRGKDPWKYLAIVSDEILSSLPDGELIDLNFEGCLVMELGSGANRPVYLIEKGKKRPLTSPQVLQRLGGWTKVMEIPAEILKDYPEGEPIN